MNEFNDGDYVKLGDEIGVYYSYFSTFESTIEGCFFYSMEDNSVHPITIDQLNKDFTEEERRTLQEINIRIFESLQIPLSEYM